MPFYLNLPGDYTVDGRTFNEFGQQVNTEFCCSLSAGGVDCGHGEEG
jgi:hypothetical protein